MCSYNIPSWLGCDSITNVIITIIPPDLTIQTHTLCPGECLTIGGVDYCPPGGFTIPYTGSDGCDSNLVLTLFAVPVLSVIGPAGVITCTNPVVALNGSGSVGNTYLWTNAAGQVLGNGPILQVNTAGCYNLTVSNTLNGVVCTDVSTACVTSNLVPPALPVIQGLTSICINQSATYTISPDPNATSYDWTLPPGATLITGGDGTTSVTVNWTGPLGGNICVVAVNGCGAGPVACLPVTLNTLPALPVLTGTDTVCPNDIASYTATVSANTTGYNWIVPPGASITSGQGTNSITVNWGNSAGGNVCLTPTNACGNGPQACFAVAAGQLPATPSVAGPSPVCVGDTVTYSTAADPGADTFTWTVPSCATITSNPDSSSISVVWDNSCSGGNICVVASNGCGSTSQQCFDVELNDVPGVSVVNGSPSPCGNSTQNYFTNPVPGATNYAWTVTGGTIVSGQGTPSINVSWNASGSGSVCLSVANGCGSGQQFCLPVNIGALPLTPVVSGPDVICSGSVTQYSTPADPAATGYTWTTSCGSIVSGQNTPNITINWTGCPNGGNVCVTTQTGCGASPTICFAVAGGTIPVAPVLSGPATPCLNESGLYCAQTDPNASNYVWTASGGTILSGQGTDCVTVEWSSLGNGTVCATASNGCGQSVQTCFPVLVDGPPAAPALDGPNQPCVDDISNYTITSADPDVSGFNWTVTNGGIILGGQGTDAIDVEWPQSGPAQVCVSAENLCGFGAITCFDLAVIAYPTPNAGPDDGICGLSYTLAGSLSTGTGLWTASGPGSAVFTDPADPQSSVSVDMYGVYTFTWTETTVNCSSQDVVEISFNSDPQLSGAILETCTPDGQDYTVSFTITAGQQPYFVSGNVGGVVNGSTYTSDLIPSGTPYNFEVFDILGCGPLTIVGQETCDCISDAGDLDLTPLAVCEDETATVAASPNAIFDPNDVSEFILHSDNGTNGNTLGAIIDQNTTGVFGYIPGLMSFNTTYFISYLVGNPSGTGVDLGDDCTDMAQGVPVIFNNYPSPNAGLDAALCGLSTTLLAMPSVGAGQWTQVSGPGTAILSDPFAAQTQVDVDQYGVYVFEWQEDNNGCLAAAQVTITFNDDPVLAGAVTESCNLLDFTYTVAFDIGGGDPPYTVTGLYPGTLSGASFLSDPIPNLSAYSFEVFDANGCGPLLVEGLVECVCATDAGQMNLNPVQVCADGIAIANTSTGAVLDPEDILLYVIHNGSGNALGSQVYGYNALPEFSLIPPMQTGVTYYISAIAGNDLDTDGTIDPNDPCISVAPGTPVVFLPLPSASFLNNVTVCEGQTGNLPIFVSSATCVDISYQLSDGTTGTLLCVQTGDVLSIPVGTTSVTATMLQVTDQDGCTQALSATGTVIVNTIPVATVATTATICNSTDSGNPTVLDFSTLVTAGDPGGSWANTDGALVTGTFPMLNFNGAVPGVYDFTYTTDSALPPCPEQSYVVQVTVEDCACPVLDFLAAAPLCNDGDALNLNTLQVESNPGTYAVASGPIGAVNFPQINGAMLDASGADPGVYILNFSLSNTPPLGCALTNSFNITISEALTAGVAAQPLEFCIGEAQTVDLDNLLSGADPGGVWTETSAVPSSGGAFNAAAGSFTITSQSAQTYRFRYTLRRMRPVPWILRRWR
ncbi:MAG: hypothetical protein IPG32_13090 [Saprospirales bacterium]|nr:hypothetical protein [Saprospirales bacterium]